MTTYNEALKVIKSKNTLFSIAKKLGYNIEIVDGVLYRIMVKPITPSIANRIDDVEQVMTITERNKNNFGVIWFNTQEEVLLFLEGVAFAKNMFITKDQYDSPQGLSTFSKFSEKSLASLEKQFLNK